MILKGATDPNQLLIAFHLPSSVNPLVPVTGHAFVLGEVAVKPPGGAMVSVAVANIAEVGNGDYTAQLTPAQALIAGKAFLYANVAGAQPWSSAEDIVDPALFANGGAGGGGGGPVAASGYRTFTLAQLRLAIQRRGQYENSGDITPDILLDFINEALAELWDILVEKWADYYTVSTTFPFVAGTDSYQLPGGFYKLRKVEILWDANASPQRWERLSPHDLDVAHEYRYLFNLHYRYRIQAGFLVFVPPPTAVQTIRIYYIPCAPLLASDTDAVDGVNGYEELVIQLALLRCKRREELPTDDIEREVARLTARVRTASDGRDATEPFSLDPHYHEHHDRHRHDGWWW